MERKLIAQHIKTIAQCDEEDSKQFAQLFQPYPLKKWAVMEVGKEHFRSIFFVLSGIVKLSHHIPKTQQHTNTYSRTKTLALYQPNELFFFPFGTHPDGVLYNIHAISASRLYVADYTSIERLIKECPKMIRHYVSIGEHYVMQTFQHLELLQEPTAHTRYEQLKKHFGKHFFLIPNEYKASYMGISRKHLSRITNAYLKHQKEPLLTEPTRK